MEGPQRYSMDGLLHEEVGEVFVSFIMHFSEALKEGLPPDSYTLTVGGYPDMNHTTKIFPECMKPYIAWLTAHTDFVAQGLIAPSTHHDYPFPTRTSAQGVAPVSETSAIIQCDFTLDQPWQWGKNYNESGVSGILDAEELCISSLDFGSDDDLHATTNLLDWERVQEDCFEIEELSGDVFPEPFDGRYQVNKPRICFRLSHCYCNSQSYSKIIAWHYRDTIGVMAFSV
ncbi:uncharacterized protein LW93_5836 [Fusarium fujikuroi]|nr:uncharacterized protein LW93_5836 [Fusarium fujikuroi]